MKVQTRGPWTIKIKQSASARPVDAHAKRNGDDVPLCTGAGGAATFDCWGTLNLVVTYGDASNPGPVDEIGRFRGQVSIMHGPVLIVVSANGNGAWTSRPNYRANSP